MNETTQLYKISAAENVARLRNCLRGDAREAVSSLLATVTDPAQIMLTLEQCYGAPEIVIDRAMEQIKKLPKPSGAAAELNAMAIKLQNIVVTIRQIDRRGYLNNPMLVREVVTKLSPHLTARWCDYAEEHGSFNEPEIMTMSRFLMREANRALRHAFVAPPQMQQKREEKKPAINLYRRAAAHTISEEETGPSVTCYDCKSGHELTRCSHFIKKTLQDRWELVKSEKLCFKCIASKHRRAACQAKPCGKNGCRQPHHKLLHYERDSAESSTTSQPTTPPASELKTLKKGTEKAMVTATSAPGAREVLLKVCPVIIQGPKREIKAEALLDEGSTVTLIDEDLARELEVDGPANQIRLHGVNTVKQEDSSMRVQMKIRGVRTQPFALTARTIKGMDLRGQAVPAEILRFPHLKKMVSHEVCYDELKPRLLIGADNWHLIVTRQIRAGKRSEPVAAKTHLG
jgi:hypothetical protein